MTLLALIAAMTIASPAPQAPASKTLAERLGYKNTDRLLIINGDDAGNAHAANLATIDSLENGLMTSATIMVPCPWFPEIARYARENPKRDFGIHLVHTSEWSPYRWAPVANHAEVKGLIDPEGYFWRSVQEVHANATPKEAEIEARAQIRKALAAGIDVTHIDSHMGTLQLHPEFHKVYVALALEFDLPLRMGPQATFERMGFPNLRAEVAALGLVFPDHLIYEERPFPGEKRKDYWMRIIKGLRPGVTELLIHAAKPTEEMKGMTGSWEERATDYELFTRDPDIRKLLQDEKIIRIGFRELRTLQRARNGGNK
jgi:predicted glycoside hydrolase/deacetylase ChbG (UPF0249 family)